MTLFAGRDIKSLLPGIKKVCTYLLENDPFTGRDIKSLLRGIKKSVLIIRE
ncbi:hypothetical protein PPIS_a4042 [Pseudoalteromonas piscicida]|uniref:Type II toxin-antitoxin system RelE/ParE family toxin n=1 Tax=Pseudoalteromonas piscicida TaxID=43662 RepID=A0ABM6NIT6_PSEO7|nr:hypothetical protein PPIS_a4042 [Pseudoalteromonas piscicida]